ncbi:MAG: 30S ribosomal protein S12 methylthiotransferase RimO [candidate division Zixibacteria bacterium]|nr:30S ribosomal protein S12 methylthiotransferase RimO [candidate division Zixibacteria bacterium]
MSDKPKKYFLSNLGCPKNEVDGNALEYYLLKRGFTRSEPEEADLLIVNTCGFIEDAKRESIDEILHLSRLKRFDGRLAVAGCLSQRYRRELNDILPEADFLFGISSPEEIASVLDGGDPSTGDRTFNIEAPYQEPAGRIIEPGSSYAYMKIADGCDNHCSYCAIPLIRGAYRSREVEAIGGEAEFLLSNGVREIILVAQDTTRYGFDLETEIRIEDLLKKLVDDERLEWLRLMYAHPARVSEELLEIISGNGKICSYLDIPLQHISDRMLKVMNRGVTSAEIKALMATIRENYPGIALRTTFLLNHPGETYDDFQQLLDFVEEIKFENLGVFVYSEEEGTPSSMMDDILSGELGERKYDELTRLQSEIVEERNRELTGMEMKVIVDEYDDLNDVYYCRNEFQAPEIDGVVLLRAGDERLEEGDMVDVVVEGISLYDLEAVLKKSPI